MAARKIAWASSILLILVLLVCTIVVLSFLRDRNHLRKAILTDELMLSRVEMTALEHLEGGDPDAAKQLMIQRVFIGLTRAYPQQDELSAYNRDRLDQLVRKFAAFRERNPDLFESREDWWLARLESWAEDVSQN